jgi:bifunctional ADP-heptose synthase (sugar kinase/adenylyltransferase)
VAIKIPRISGIIGYSYHAGDLFHVGQLYQLLECHKHCDKLIVGLLTDQAIASYKRLPVIPYPWREAIYKELRCVDRVVPQDSRDPTENLKNLKPDVLFHGDDWTEIPGSEWMKANGKKVIVTSYFYGISTSSIIERCINYDN